LSCGAWENIEIKLLLFNTRFYAPSVGISYCHEFPDLILFFKITHGLVEMSALPDIHVMHTTDSIHPVITLNILSANVKSLSTMQ
jgi:hypothetical protein